MVSKRNGGNDAYTNVITCFGALQPAAKDYSHTPKLKSGKLKGGKLKGAEMKDDKLNGAKRMDARLKNAKLKNGKLKDQVKARNKLGSFAYGLKNQLANKEMQGRKLSNKETAKIKEIANKKIAKKLQELSDKLSN